METVKSQPSFFCTLLNYWNGDWLQTVLLHRRMPSEYIDALWIYCWNVIPSFYPKWGMSIFTGGRKSLKHWLNISARSHIHAFIHIQAFPLEQWSATYGILGKKGMSADLEWYAAGPVPFSTEVICHPSADSQDFASCEAICPQTHLYPRFKSSGKQKPLPLLEPQYCHSADWSGDSWLLVWNWSSLGLERYTPRSHLTSAWNRGKKPVHCLWKFLLL